MGGNFPLPNEGMSARMQILERAFQGDDVRACVALISSINAARVVDLPLPVGPEMMTSPVLGSVSRRRSGCRLQELRSLTELASRRTAKAVPRTVLNTLMRQ